MVTHSLGERQNSILSAIIEEYVRTARPVASKELQEREEFDFGPATIRNEMRKLDRWGYLDQPHTSAGGGAPPPGGRLFLGYFIKGKGFRGPENGPVHERLHTTTGH